MDALIFMKAIFRTVFIITNNLYAIPAYFMWIIVLTPLRVIHPTLFWKIEGHLFRWLLLMVSNWLWTAGYTVSETGDQLLPYINDRCVVVSNHLSTGDVPTLMHCLSDKPVVSNRMMWIIDVLFKYTHFGIVSQVHKDFFILQGKETRKRQLTDLQKHLSEVYMKKGSGWLVLFPEGGFLRKRRESSKRYAKKNGYPVLENVTLPRTGALEVIIKNLGKSEHINGFTSNNGIKRSPSEDVLKWLIDVTIGYPESKPLDAFCILFGHRPPCKTTVLYRVYPISEIPRQSEKLLIWLYERWEEKDKLLEEFYKTGHFPTLSSNNCHGDVKMTENIVKVSSKRVFPIHFFYIASIIIQYMSVKWIVSLIWM